MSILKKNFRRIFMLTGILIFALSITSFAAVESEDVATIGEEGYATLVEAISAIETSGEIKIIKDMELEGSVTIPKGKEITLDLNGKVISGIDTQTKRNFELISNKGTLTIEDSVGTGKITISAITDRGYGNYSAPIANVQGTLIINGGIIEHKGGTTMAYAIDSLTNGGNGNATVIINDGKLSSTYIGIRQFANSDSCENKLTINSGDISSSNGIGSVFLQSPSTKKNIGTLDINGGLFSVIYIYGEVGGDTTALRVNIAEDIEAEIDYDCIEARIGEVYYETLAKAIAAANTCDEIILVKDATVKDSTIIINNGNEYTIDLNGNEITSSMNSEIFKIANGKLTIKDTASEKGKVSAINDVFFVSGDTTAAGELIISEGVVVESEKSNCVYIKGEGATLRTAGDLTTRATRYCAIQGNGNPGSGGIKIYITGGKVINEKNIAIYFPNTSLLEITGGQIKGTTAIYQKAGTLNISGDAILEANGVKADYVNNGNGANSTGEAVVVDFCNYPGGEPSINVTGGYFKSANNRDIGSYATTEGEEIVGFISGGYFSSDPTEYLVEGKIAVTSDNPDYKYMVADKVVDVETAVESAAPSVEVPDGLVINDEKFEADTSVMESVASSHANDEKVVGTAENAATALETAGIIDSGDTTTEITVVVQPYIDIVVESGDVENKVLTLDISAKYNVIATTASGETKIETSGDNKNAVVLKEEQTLTVTEPIEITIALPTGFATSSDTLYVHHTKGNKTYVYEANISADGTTLTFLNPHGFSKFEVKPENGIATNETTGNTYLTLEEAIAEVNDGDVIMLLSGDTEIIQITRDYDFSFILKDAQKFSGDITVGANATITKTASGDTEVIYAYDYTAPTSRPSTGGGSSTTEYRITVTQTTGGKISPSTTNVEEGEDITFEIKVDEGYKIKDVIVDAKSVGAVSTYTFENVDKKHAITAIYEKVQEWVNPYEDVKENDWYYNAVKLVSQKGLFNGMKEDEFGAEITMTRGMLVTVLYRLEGQPATNKSIPFADVDMSMYYANAISWAKQNNIVNGVDENNFMPNAEITREQLVTILYRYAKVKGMDISVGEDTNILSYDDAFEVSEYAIEAFQWACGSGIIEGRTESTLAPKGNAKRCEVATMILRFCEK